MNREYIRNKRPVSDQFQTERIKIEKKVAKKGSSLAPLFISLVVYLIMILFFALTGSGRYVGSMLIMMVITSLPQIIYHFVSRKEDDE